MKKHHELTAVGVDCVAPPDRFIGGRALGGTGRRTFYPEIKVTEGANTKDEKADYPARVFAAMENLLGPLDPASYAVIQEVRADAWGYGGPTQERRYIQGRPL